MVSPCLENEEEKSSENKEEIGTGKGSEVDRARVYSLCPDSDDY